MSLDGIPEADDVARLGRPRSEDARRAVLHAVDDLLVEQGYAAMTMKGIAERAGVGRQTVYRWWSNKAEILMEASVIDAREEIVSAPQNTPREELAAYLEELVRFLTVSPAGLAYRALLGEAQHDPQVRALVAANDLLTERALVVLGRLRPALPAMPEDRLASVELIGPILYAVLARSDAEAEGMLVPHATALIRAWEADPVGHQG